MDHPVIFQLKLSDVDAVTQITSENKTLFRKQLIYVGDFEKDDMKFSVNERLINHWVATHDELIQNGIEVPVPVQHSENPEARRGTVEKLEAALDDKGRMSLYGLISFTEKEHETLANSADVSIFVPPSFKDGKGRTYHRPIRHVAITDYPVVPDLGDWDQVIVASFNSDDEGDDMSLKLALAKAFSLEGVTDETSDDDLVKKLKAAMKPEDKKLADPPKPDDKKKEMSDEDDKEDKKIAAGFLTLARENREGKIDSLVRDGRITSAVAKDLKDKWTTDEQLTLSLSDDGGSSQDMFNDMILALSKNDKIVKFDESTGSQSTSIDPAKNPLIADAEKRAKASA